MNIHIVKTPHAITTSLNVRIGREEYYSGFVEESLGQIKKDIRSHQTIFSSKVDHLHNTAASISTENNIATNESPDAARDMSIQQTLDIYPDLTESDIEVTILSLAQLNL